MHAPPGRRRMRRRATGAFAGGFLLSRLEGFEHDQVIVGPEHGVVGDAKVDVCAAGDPEHERVSLRARL